MKMVLGTTGILRTALEEIAARLVLALVLGLLGPFKGSLAAYAVNCALAYLVLGVFAKLILLATFIRRWKLKQRP